MAELKSIHGFIIPNISSVGGGEIWEDITDISVTEETALFDIDLGGQFKKIKIYIERLSSENHYFAILSIRKGGTYSINWTTTHLLGLENNQQYAYTFVEANEPIYIAEDKVILDVRYVSTNYGRYLKQWANFMQYPENNIKGKYPYERLVFGIATSGVVATKGRILIKGVRL